MNVELARQIAAGPGYFPHSIDPVSQQVLFVELDRAAIEAASFLDGRILDGKSRGGWASLAEVASAVPADLRDDGRFIFHVGHCGSTLISRLLGRLNSVLSIREPQSLRDLAQVGSSIDEPESEWNPDEYPKRAKLLRRLLARTFVPSETAVIKATSFVSDIASYLVGPRSKATLLYVSPQRYMETILAGPNSRTTIASTSGVSLRRVHRRVGSEPWRRWSMSEGERVALSWVAEMTALATAAKILPAGTCSWVNFDGFLADPHAGLSRIANDLGLQTGPAEIDTALASGELARYSKAREHPFDAETRRQIMDHARAEHSNAIGEGMRWLEQAARDFPVIAEVVDRSEGN